MPPLITLACWQPIGGYQLRQHGVKLSLQTLQKRDTISYRLSTRLDDVIAMPIYRQAKFSMLLLVTSLLSVVPRSSVRCWGGSYV